jgi:hypothetical protein
MPEDERGSETAPTVETSSNTILDAARDTNTGAGRAGNRIQAGNLPTPVMEIPVGGGGFDYLKDLIPDISGKLGVNLDAAEYKSSGIALQCGFVSTRAEEVVNPSGAEPPLVGANPYRDHRLWCEWGSGTSVLQGEIDVGQGNAMSVSGANLRVMLVDWTWSRDIAGFTYTKGTSDLAASSYTNPVRGTCTTRVCAPYQVTVDLLNPPTVQDLKRQLAQALMSMTYIR